MFIDPCEAARERQALCNSWTQALWCRQAGGNARSSSAACPWIAFGTHYPWRALGLLCWALHSSSFFSRAMPRLSESRAYRGKFSSLLLQTSKQMHFDWKQDWEVFCLPYSFLLSSRRFFPLNHQPWYWCGGECRKRVFPEFGWGNGWQ